MRDIITIGENYTISCDNIKCNYSVKFKRNEIKVARHINRECPNCGENLLTESDYRTGILFIKLLEWVNKWFSWLSIFIPNKENYSSRTVQFKDGINLKD